MNQILRKVLLCGGVMIASTGIALAADTVTLKLGTHLTANAPGVVEGANILMDVAKKKSNGEIKFEFYPAEQAGKAAQMFDLVRAGAVDVGDTASAYVSSDKLPLLGLMELPGLASNTCSVSRALFKLGAPGGPIYEGDLKPAGVRILAYLPYPPYGPSASRKEITKVDELKGMKIRSAGGLMELSLQKLGAVPVKMASPEVYQALSKGTVDSVLFSFLSVKDYDLNSVAKYGTTGYSFGTPGDIMVISERKFQSLSKVQQDALVAAGHEASEHWCNYLDRAEVKNIADMRASGMNIYTWSKGDVAQLKAATADVSADWAKKLDARGKPASKALEAFKAALSQ